MQDRWNVHSRVRAPIRTGGRIGWQGLRIGSILELLDAENKILKSAAIGTLGYLAPVDSAGRITRALAKPKQKSRIVGTILSVQKGDYRTPECRNTGWCYR